MSARYQIRGRSAAEVAASVESGVQGAVLSPGALLPAVRTLAGDLRISPATVGRAYQMLRQRGLVETAGRNGTRIRPRPPVAAARSGLRPPLFSAGLDLSTGEPDQRLLPLLGRHLGAVAGDLSAPAGYATADLLPQLAGLARARLTADGVPADAVTLTSGALDGIERVLAAHLRPGDPIAVEDPGWSNVYDLISALGLRPVSVPVDDEGPTEAGVRAALAAGARALVVTTRAHNPTGAAVTAERARALRDLLAAHADVLLIEDDHAAELAPVPLHSLAATTTAWAFVRSLSKPFGPDLRVAVVAGDEATIARVTGRMRIGAGWVSTVLQRLVIRLWRDAAVAAAVAAAGESYETRRRALCDALVRRGVPTGGRSGINVWVPVADETRAVTALRDAGYAVAPGSLYRLSSPPGIRITVSPLDLADVEPLADAVARAVGSADTAPFTA
ncbi:MAG TPA: aminotransferase class I/II-fold pyridoxal phosphate-dependent enzyme [Micromonosporaceae bacterium]